MRRANTRDPALKLINEEITSDIIKHKQDLWKEQLDSHWNDRHNTHILWKPINDISNIIVTPNNSQTRNPQNKLIH